MSAIAGAALIVALAAPLAAQAPWPIERPPRHLN